MPRAGRGAAGCAMAWRILTDNQSPAGVFLKEEEQGS